MKLKAFSILFLICWCFTLGGFAQNVIPDRPYHVFDPNDPNADVHIALDKKIEEIMSIMNMHRQYDLEEQTVAYFQKLLSSNKLVFKKAAKKEQSKRPHPLSNQLLTPKEIAAYWRSIKDKQNFYFEIVNVNIIELVDATELPNLPDFEVDKKAEVIFKYKFTSNPAEKAGEASSTLYHMKRCIWD